MRSEIDDLASNVLTEEELTRARAKLLGGEAIRNQSNSAFGVAVAVDELMGLGVDAHKLREEQIEKISLDDIRRVAAKYFRSDSRVEATVLPPVKKQSAN
jgi:zinc protease